MKGHRRAPWAARVLSVAVTTVALGCEEKNAIWVVRGSTAERLEFGVSRRRGGTSPISLGGLAVRTCPSASDTVRNVWIVLPDSGAGPVARIRYGEPPPGYRSLEGPVALGMGCHYASILGTGRVHVQVKLDGSVMEMRFRVLSDST